MRIFSFVLAAMLVGGCVQIDTSTGLPKTASASTTPVQEPAPQHLAGNGKKATDKFRLEAGLTVISAKHQGSGYFGAWLLDSSGTKVDLVANGAGQFDGSRAIGVKAAGDYVLDVSADGDWTFDITQPRPQAAEATTSFQGSTPSAVGPFSLSAGLKKFSFTHDGTGYFGVWLVDKDGNKKELIANGSGKQDGSKATGVTGGIYYFAVDANGPWTIKIE